jgi:hypothetical protein
MGSDLAIAGDSIPQYNGTVFISYARDDETVPVGNHTIRGWVTFFWEQLRFELMWLARHENDAAARLCR